MLSARWFPRWSFHRGAPPARPDRAPRYRAVACPYCGAVVRLPVLEDWPGNDHPGNVLVVRCSGCGSAYRC